ncbi:hypothetical protein [Paenibacillus glucanolyticus]|uniref:hypothetical protein n=1 Tax=Paenibacillus glucanolyticus TaxID=59843 RepID=UPI0020B12D92|nr:hypothetical protein [Paenibacillus glucanolyticus]
MNQRLSIQIFAHAMFLAGVIGSIGKAQDGAYRQNACYGDTEMVMNLRFNFMLSILLA